MSEEPQVQRRRRAAERDREYVPEATPEAEALRSFQRASSELDHALAEHLGMRPMDYAALGLVMGDDTIGPAGISARLGISTGSASELVDRMEGAGHLVRRPHPTDRRKVVLAATDSGAGRLIGALQDLLTDIDALSEDFTAKERAAIQRYLLGATARMEAFADRTRQEEPAPPPRRGRR